MKVKVLMIGLLVASLLSCKTIDMEEVTQIINEQTDNTENTTPDKSQEVENKEVETNTSNEKVEEVTIVESTSEEVAEEENIDFVVQESLKVQDMEKTVVYIERPVYIPEEKNITEEVEKVTGYEASVESEKKSVVKPQNYKYGTFIYQFNEDMVYEVYAEPYHLTDIMLEPGEVVIGTPLLSEDESVWELTAGVGKDTVTGLDVQHLFIKPAYSRLDSTLVIITDRRTYHLRIKSFSDTHMAMVRFNYPNQKNIWAKKPIEETGISYKNQFVRISHPELLSFDYKMSYSIFKKPEFLPKQVYDDGQTTYITVDEIVLQKQLPVIFDEKNEIINYSVKENTFIIPRLVNKVTLKLGKEKVTVEKKKTKISELEG